jgi:hypothetical protein
VDHLLILLLGLPDPGGQLVLIGGGDDLGEEDGKEKGEKEKKSS